MNTQYFYTKSIIRRCVKYFFNNYKIFLALKHAHCTLQCVDLFMVYSPVPVSEVAVAMVTVMPL